MCQVGKNASQSAVNMSRRGSSGTVGEASLGEDEGEAVIFNEEWTQEKEQQIRKLEERLRRAQRGWSDEQEEILEPVEFGPSLFHCDFFLLFSFSSPDLVPAR